VFEEHTRRSDALQTELRQAELGEKLALEPPLSEEEQRIRSIHAALVEALDATTALGLGMEERTADALTSLHGRAETLARRLRPTTGNRAKLEVQLARAPNSQELNALIAISDERIRRTMEHLAATAARLEEHGVSVAAYQQTHIEATGEISSDVLEEPAPLVEVHRLTENGVEFNLRLWVNTEDYGSTYCPLTREIKRRFVREGIAIPDLQRDVHHHYAERAPHS
jgi:small-conductance mechanosensitive channel